MRLAVENVPVSAPADWIGPEVKIPDLLQAAPHLRPVLDRYGLRGCGGKWGPAESLGFFARAHDVPLEQLLCELHQGLALSEPLPEGHVANVPRLGTLATCSTDAIYRPFFRAGILTVLTLGAAWGAYLLLRIGLDGSFTAAGVHEVNAHGHAQIFGWVGLFVMGFAYQAFPRFKHTSLAYPRLAYLSLWLMVGGVVTRSILQPLAAGHFGLSAAAVAGSALEVAATGLFAWVVLATWRHSGKPLAAYDWYVISALAWFLLQAVYESVYLAATLGATGPDLVNLVATWQPALRDIQVHGFALLMILGVSQRLLFPMYGLPAPAAGRSLPALACLNAAVAGEAVGLVLMRLQGHAWAALWYASVLLLAGSAGWLVAGWHLFARAADGDRTLKFLRAAYVWLFISLALLVLLPAYQHGLLAVLAPDSGAARLGFSHAYYGAVRHAITVGFVSLMIVGVAARVVPTLGGFDSRTLPGLWAPFLLLNAGCGLRVVGQTLTDFSPNAFPIAAVSGLLEVTGLALWGGHLWSLMRGRAAAPAAATAPLVPGAPLAADNLVGEVLETYPGLLDTFVSFGFRPLMNPLARKTVARGVTVGRACRLLGVDTEHFVAVLNEERQHLPAAAAGAKTPGCGCCGHHAAAGPVHHDTRGACVRPQ